MSQLQFFIIIEKISKFKKIGRQDSIFIFVERGKVTDFSVTLY